MAANDSNLITRAGTFLKQPGGYRAFIPKALPPDPPLEMDWETVRLLAEASLELGRLDGAGALVPNPDLFVGMYVRQEAVLSSQIEGTQCTLEDVLRFELDASAVSEPEEIAEVVNYVGAMNYGLERLEDFPLSLRLIREIHERLMKGVRGSALTPGEFRRTQNWIGPAGGTLLNASFVPPPVPDMNDALGDLEKFLHETERLPALIHFGLVHAQFETIHPFLDGNGRIGRLLIAFLLCHRKILRRPLLYLSLYFKQHRQEYYDRLTAVRNDGQWEPWIKFFLKGVAEVSRSATSTAQAILALQQEHRQLTLQRVSNAALSQLLLDLLLQYPLISVRMVESRLNCAFVTANKLVEQFTGLGLLREITGGLRNRQYEYKPYLELFER
ncbi:Fic family protein [Chthoniobacter flavus]|nr:Fic family protein [Chthoniobacter flavus]